MVITTNADERYAGVQQPIWLLFYLELGKIKLGSAVLRQTIAREKSCPRTGRSAY